VRESSLHQFAWSLANFWLHFLHPLSAPALRKHHVIGIALHCAAVVAAGLELGGLLGGTLSGVLSDKTIKAAGPNPSVGLVGRRVQICMAYTVACIGVLFALKAVPAGVATHWCI
jgi:MFS family permease